MSKNEIIQLYFKSNEVRKIIRNISQDDYYSEDLHAEIFSILLKYDESKLQELHENGKMPFEIIGITKKQFKSTNSDFYRKYKRSRPLTEEIEFDLEDEPDNKQELLDKLETEINCLSLPDRNLVKLFLDHSTGKKLASINEIHRITGISKKYISKKFKMIKEILKSKLNDL